MKKLNCIFSIFLLIFCLAACGNSTMKKIEDSFRKSIEKIESSQVEIQDLTDFEWDYLYTFSPYTSTDQIEEIIGFKSAYIMDNMINEGITYLLFVKDNTVVANIQGYADSLGYSINFGCYDNYLCIDSSEKCTFSVTNEDDVKYLEYLPEE